MVLPSGSWLGNDWRTSASFTTATKGLSNASLSVKSRPLLSGIPSAAKVPGATTESTTLGARLQHGFAGSRSITYAPVESTEPGGAIVAPAANTPGNLP